MVTLTRVIQAMSVAQTYDSGAAGRLRFWAEQIGERELEFITSNEVDEGVAQLIERGRLKAGRGSAALAVRTGKPLAGATINRYLSTLAGVYKFARQHRLLSRSHVPPTRGIEKMPEPGDPNKYVRHEEVERLVAAARVADRTWCKLVALIVLAFHTGMRRGSLMGLRWQDIDLDARTATVARTKNGQPHVAVLSARCVSELRCLTRTTADDRVFEGRAGKPYDYRYLWAATCKLAHLEGRTLHWLRHGCGSALAGAGISQAQIMQVMGHRSLIASARYMHSNVSDRRAVIERVFP